MKNQFFNLIKQTAGSRIIAAVSGGSDSAALLHLLHSVSSELQLTIYTVHFNHQLRGAESDEDAEFTQTLSASMNIPCYVIKLNVTEYAAQHHTATEEAARILRYQELEQMRVKLSADYIATAHTKDDRTETILMNIIRGTGLAGLCPLPSQREHFLRPLVYFTKTELQQYLAANGLSFRTDSTNLTDMYRRNKMRNTIIPILKSDFNPSLNNSLAGLAEIAENANSYIMAQTFSFLEKQGDKIQIADLIREPNIIRHSVIRELIKNTKGEYKDITFAEIKRIDSCLGSSFCTELIGGGIFAISDGTTLKIAARTSPAKITARCIINCDSVVSIPTGTVIVSPHHGSRQHSKHILYISENSFPLTAVFADDVLLHMTMEPLGMPGKHKKISRILKDSHVPQEARYSIPIFLDRNGTPIWIPGICLAEQVKKTENKIYKITIV